MLTYILYVRVDLNYFFSGPDNKRGGGGLKAFVASLTARPLVCILVVYPGSDCLDTDLTIEIKPHPDRKSQMKYMVFRYK